jgi:hypothetical protein
MRENRKRRAKAKAAIEMAKWRHQHGGQRVNENGESCNNGVINKA